MTHDDRETGIRGDESDLPPDTALWKKITSETEMLRRRTTPMHVQQRILSSLLTLQPGLSRRQAQRNSVTGLSASL